MQDINLLQNKLNDNSHKWQNSQRFSIVVLSLVLILELVAAGFFYLLRQRAEEQTLALQQDNANIQSKLSSMEDELMEAKGFQAQTKNLAVLLDSHVVWNKLLQEVSDTTFKNAQYLSLSSDTTGKITIEGMSNNYSELGKMLLSLETSDLFKSVKLVSTALSTGAESGVMFSVDVRAEQSIFSNKE